MEAYTLQSTPERDDLLHGIGIERRGRLKEPVIMLDHMGADSKRKFIPISGNRSLKDTETSLPHLCLGPKTEECQTLLLQHPDKKYPDHLLLKAIIPKHEILVSPGATLLGQGRWSSDYLVQIWMLPHKGYLRYQQIVPITRQFHWRFEVPLSFELYWDAKVEHPRPILRAIGMKGEVINHSYQ